MTVELEAKYLKTPKEAQLYLQQQFDFPDYYGHNLDAFYDCLTEICEETDILVFVSLADREEDTEDSYFEKILLVMQDAVDVNEHLSLEIEEEVAVFSLEDDFWEEEAEDDI